MKVFSATLNLRYRLVSLTRLMKYELITCQELAWQPKPEEIPVVGKLVKEGTNLPNSVTEDIGGFSLCRSYSVKQERTIHRLRMRETEREWRRKSPKAWRRRMQ